MTKSLLGPFCKAVGIDDEVLSGEKELKCDIKEFNNGIAWELNKYKTAKRGTMKDLANWLVNIFGLTCEDETLIERDLNERFKKLTSLRNTFQKSPKGYPGELERLLKWPFDVPQLMGAESIPVFEPAARATLGPKLLKVLKAADNDDSMDISSPDDDELSKRRKAREELVQLKKDMVAAKKTVTGFSERLNELNNRCLQFKDVSKSSVSQRRRIENDINKLKIEWKEGIVTWRECIERLNHVISNKGNYMDVGYMVRRNKTKQGIFDELSYELEKTVEEYVHKITSFLDKERRKRKSVPREYRQKSKKDRKRTKPEDEEEENSKKLCISDETCEGILSVDEFMNSQQVESFKSGKFSNTLRVIFIELTSMPIPCKVVHEVIFVVLNELEKLNIDKIPPLTFAGNIFMEVRAVAMLEAFSEMIKFSKIDIRNDGSIKFKLIGASFDVTLPDQKHLVLGIRDVSKGNPDTSLDLLKDVFGKLMGHHYESVDYSVLSSLSHIIKTAVITHKLLDRPTLEILFFYKQNIAQKVKACMNEPNTILIEHLATLNKFCTGVHFLSSLAKLTDVTVLAWEQMTQSRSLNSSNSDNHILSTAVQQIYNFCQVVDPLSEITETTSEFNIFLKKDKKLENLFFAPYKNSLFNTVFHNSASLWFLHDSGILDEFLKKLEDQNVKPHPDFKSFNELQLFSVSHALGLIGKLVVVPMWTVLEEINADIGTRYISLLRKIETWCKDATLFMTGQEHLFDDVPLSYDAVYVSLIRNDEVSRLTKELLEIIFIAFSYFIKSFLFATNITANSTNLNGAESEDVKVTIHKDFEAFNRLSMCIHSSSTFALDALMFYSKEKKTDWQEKLCGPNNLKIFESIQKNTNKQMKCLYRRKIKLNSIKEQCRKVQEELSKCQLIEKRYKLTDDLMKWGGLWKSEKEIDGYLKDMKETDRMNALKAQIRFRRHVLCETHETGLLDLAHDGECFNYAKLYENLKIVIQNKCHQTETDNFELSSATDDESLRTQIYDQCKNAHEIAADSESNICARNENFYWLLGKLVSHTFSDEEAKFSFSGVCLARRKVNGMYVYFMKFKERERVYKFSEGQINSDHKKGYLCVIEPTAKDFIGSRLSRGFYKDDGDLEWHDCQVIDVVGQGPEYVVEFDYYGSTLQFPQSSEEIPKIGALTFTSHLLEDYRTDRLRFLEL